MIWLATGAALVCLVALWMWRPVVELFQTSQRLDERAAEKATQTGPDPAVRFAQRAAETITRAALGDGQCPHDLRHTYPTGATQCLRCGRWLGDDQGYVY